MPRDPYADVGAATRQAIERAAGAPLTSAGLRALLAAVHHLTSYSRMADTVYRDDLAQAAGVTPRYIGKGLAELSAAGIVRWVPGSRGRPSRLALPPVDSGNTVVPPIGGGQQEQRCSSNGSPDGPNSRNDSARLEEQNRTDSRNNVVPPYREVREDFREESSLSPPSAGEESERPSSSVERTNGNGTPPWFPIAAAISAAWDAPLLETNTITAAAKTIAEKGGTADEVAARRQAALNTWSKPGMVTWRAVANRWDDLRPATDDDGDLVRPDAPTGRIRL